MPSAFWRLKKPRRGCRIPSHPQHQARATWKEDAHRLRGLQAKDGKIDHNKTLTGDDLLAFVNQKLMPYLHGFKQKASGPDTIEYKIGEIFGEIKNKIQSGYNLREVIDHVDELRFGSWLSGPTQSFVRTKPAGRSSASRRPKPRASAI